jgi:serine/threonine protein kinase
MSPIFCNKGHENPTGSLFCQTCGEKLSPPPAKLMLSVGEVLEGRYRIAQQIGQGGFGRTYLCENLNRFNEPCVLKEFAPQVQGVYALNKAKTLFEREANVLHQLTHPQIPRFRELFQVNSGGGGLFLVQDYVAGPTYRYLLGQRMVNNETFSEAEVRKFLLDVLPVLEYIHSLGVIHRDIAPDNLILRSSDNLPVLIDFGGVKQLAVNAEIQAIGGTDLPTCLGKVGYAPHEQLQRGQTYPHSDLYALAATALVLATGKEPTSLIDPQNLQWNWRNHVTLDPKFGEVLDRMLHPNTSARFQTATEAIAALQSIGVTKGSPVGNTGIGTVMISPNGQQKGQQQGGSGPVKAPSGGQGEELWPILKRSWLALAGVALVGTGGWAAYKAFSGSTSGTDPATPTTTTNPSAVESPASSASATPSSSPSERSTGTAPESSTASMTQEAAPDNSSGNGGNNRRANYPSRDNSNGTTRRSPKSEVATSSRNTQREASATPKAPATPKPEVESDADNNPTAPSRSSPPTDNTPATPQRSRSSSNRQSSSNESDNTPSSTPRRPSRSRNSDTPRRPSSSSGEFITPSPASRSSAASTPSRSRRSTENTDNEGSSQRTARESNNNRSRSSSSAPRSSGSSGSSSTKPSEEPLF